MSEVQRLGPYELLREVGYGGMGSVFLARRVGPGGFQKRVAIKTIHPHLAKQRAFVEMFLDEARIAAAMSHPNVAQVFDLGEVDGRYFITMEYLHGEHLGVVRDRVGSLQPGIVARIASLAAQGLHHAHEARGENGEPLGLVHRDVSPQNIFLTYDGQVKVTDFGIARAEGRLAETTDTGRIKGKCAYMAPEQVTSRPIDRRADVFALGVVMRELLAGERLFAGTTDAEILLKIVNGEIPPLDESIQCPQELSQIIDRALAHDPESRYSTTAELAEALDAFSAAAGVGTIGALMRAHFQHEKDEKDRAARTDPSAVLGDSSPRALADTVLAGAPVHRGRRLPLVWLGLALTLVVGGVLYGWSREPEAVNDFVPNGARVRVDSEPSGASVLLDGEAIGATPVVARGLTLGRHQLRLSLSGFEPMDVSFDADRREIELSYRLRPREEEEEQPAESVAAAESGVVAMSVAPPNRPTMQRRRTTASESEASEAEAMEATPVETPTGTARLSLVTQPWATISINGRDFGRTPLYQRSVPAGLLRLELRARGTGPIETRFIRAEPDTLVSDRMVLSE